MYSRVFKSKQFQTQGLINQVFFFEMPQELLLFNYRVLNLINAPYIPTQPEKLMFDGTRVNGYQTQVYSFICLTSPLSETY